MTLETIIQGGVVVLLYLCLHYLQQPGVHQILGVALGTVAAIIMAIIVTMVELPIAGAPQGVLVIAAVSEDGTNLLRKARSLEFSGVKHNEQHQYANCNLFVRFLKFPVRANSGRIFKIAKGRLCVFSGRSPLFI